MDSDEQPLVSQSSNVSWYIGTAAEDLPDGSIELKVFCPQIVPAGIGGTLSGDDTSITVRSTVYGKNAQQNDTVQSGSTFTCLYYGGGDLPLSMPPKVRKGESVEVRQYDTSNTYYWRPRGANNNLRTVDHLLISVGASPTIGDKTDSNSYCLHISPLTKQIMLSMSKANGEAMGFNVTIDGEAGNLGIVNSDGDSIVMLKNNNTIALSNCKGTSITITDKNVVIVAPDNILLNAKRVVTNLTGSSRNGTAFQDFYACMTLIKKCFDEIRSVVSAPYSHNRLLDLAQKAVLEDDEGR